MRTERSRIGDAVINRAVAGDGPAVLLLHGWPQTGHAWRHVVPLLTPRYRVVIPDLPGFGASSKPASGYEKVAVADRLAELMTALGHDRFHVVGHDLGGQIAYPLARKWGDRTISLALVEAGIPGLGDKDDAANPWRGGSWHFGFNMLSDLPELLVAGREREYLRFLFFRDTIGLVQTDAIGAADLDHYAAALAQPGGLRGSFAHYRTLLQDRADNRALAASAPPLNMPVLVVGGDRGIGLSWQDTVAAAADRVTGHLIADCGHYVPEEQPQLLADHLAAHFVRADAEHGR